MYTNNKSHTEIIIERCFEKLASSQEFDEKTLSNLHHLAGSGELSQYTKLEEAIKAKPEGENENNRTRD